MGELGRGAGDPTGGEGEGEDKGEEETEPEAVREGGGGGHCCRVRSMAALSRVSLTSGGM